MPLSTFAHRAIVQAHREELQREAQVRRARRIARRTVAACCAADAVSAGTVEGALSRHPIRPRVLLAVRIFAKAGA